ncbi:neuroglian [Trichonephila clavata]|uniref:Neuroglian n=1 Tax=Trichonephila clavata TaxID=2740835 RepID=A0A8X6G5V4_TRICU|nr:neuroglian [Trichonephila clavata]
MTPSGASALFLFIASSLLTIGKSAEPPVVPYPPTIVKQPPHEQLYQVAQTQDEKDNPFMLECEAQGNPEPVYRWMKNGLDFEYVAYDKRISQQPRRGTLVFTKPEDIDEGLYQCFASNRFGTSVSNAVFLRKSELSSFLDVEAKEKVVSEGDPLSLNCNPPTGYPRPTIFWMIQSYTGSLRTINSSRITVDPEGDLHFSNVTIEDDLDEAMYACSATSKSRNEYKFGNKIILKVDPSGGSGQSSPRPVKQYVSPPNIVALRGKQLELSCIFGGTPLPEIKWSKRRSEMYSNKYTYTNYGKTLQIKSVDFDDAGTYECVGSNGVGTPITHAMTVGVHAVPYWITAPNNTNAAEEEIVKFVCDARAYPEPKLQWLINGEPIEKAQPNPRRKLEGNMMIIERLEKSDTAVYQCNASNVHGYAFKDFYLNVLALPPTIVEEPVPLTKAVVTSLVTLICRVFGAPKPEVRWSKEGQELSGGRYQVLDNGDLHISNALKTDEGMYTCSASNKLGDTQAQGKLEVKGKTKITQPPENFEVAAGNSATFRCNAEADTSLALTIQWLFNGQQIDFDQDPRIVQASDNSLTISKTLELDSGVFTCVAQTELDKDEAQAILTVQDVPNPPRIVHVDCDGLSAMLVWKPMGDRRAPILSYSVQFNTSFTPDTWENAFKNIPAADTRVKVEMSPWANYTFRVRARNKIGPSEPSGPSQHCATPEAVPYKNPDKVMGRGTQTDNLVISWTPMPLIEHNAPEFFYKVFWKQDDDPQATWKSEKITDWRQNQLVIDYQPTFKRYRIKVEAHNRRGQAPVPPEVIGYSGEDVPKEAPLNFRLLHIRDAKSAVFEWNPVSPDSLYGHFRGYKIQTWTSEETEDHLREVIVPRNVTEALVDIFRPYSRNIVRVCAFNDVYNGPPSDAIDFLTPEGTPGPVSYFEAIPMGASALYLIWKRPMEPNGNLTGYRIYYRKVDGTSLGTVLERQPAITDFRETRAKLAGLQPDTKYRVIIHACTRVGQGDPYYIEVKTNEQAAENVPDIPNFVWAHLPGEQGKAGISVTWVPAVDGHPGSYFYVQFRRKGEGHWDQTAFEENEDSVIVKGLDFATLYEMRVVAVDGHYETPSRIEEIETGGLVLAAPEGPENIATAAWFIGMLCAIALLLLLLILVCLVKRNRGGKYSVHEKEVAQGRELDYPDDGGFNEYSKPIETHAVPRGSRTSLTSSYKGHESDTDSMADYGEGEMGKFGEDGSFIGQYIEKDKKGAQTSPSALATFV